VALDDRGTGLLFPDLAPGEIEYVPGAGLFDNGRFLLGGRDGLLPVFRGALFQKAGQGRSPGHRLTTEKSIKRNYFINMLQSIRGFVRKNLFLRKLIGYHLASSGLFDSVIRNYELSDSWKKRIEDVLKADDNKFIERVPDAGAIKKGKQIMHNGLKIHLGSYYGPEYSKMLLLSKGVHEPQEERIFGEALKTLSPSAVMIEMGAFWSFYSMWFNQEVPGARNFMIEPDEFNIGQGKRNFRLNKMKGDFVQAFIGRESTHDQPVDTLAIDDFVRERGLPFVDMLHSDIQGFEFDMLLGAERSFAEKKIGYVFISTHSNDIHYKCLDFLKQRDFVLLASIDLDETYSEDGLIAARAPFFPGIDPIALSKKTS
jgi:hypothetical protein